MAANNRLWVLSYFLMGIVFYFRESVFFEPERMTKLYIDLEAIYSSYIVTYLMCKIYHNTELHSCMVLFVVYLGKSCT